MQTITKITLLLILASSIAWAQTLRLNEIVSANQGSLLDEDGDTPDWIELYNSSSSPLNLQGFGLSDDIGDPYKWTFETGQISAGGHAIVFASDKDRQGMNIFWDLIISWGAEWNYFVGTTNPPSDWNTTTFDDSGWSVGPSGFGYGDDDDNTIIPTTLSVFLRKSFTLQDTAALSGLLFHIDYDDGYIAYINGVEFSRANLGVAGTPADNNATADSYTEPALPQGFALPSVPVPFDLLREGENVIAIQVHNHSLSSSDLTAMPFLSFGSPNVPGTPLPDYLLSPPQSLFHANFKISSSGELVMLTSPDGGFLDTIRVPELPADISWGREPDASNNLYYFNPTSPGSANSGGFTILAEPPTLAPEPGFYNGGIALSLGTPPAGRVYHYTLDGTIPTLSSTTYATPMPITQTTVVRVLSSEPDGVNPLYTAYSYFINEDSHLPVMSLIFEPDDFFAHDSGMYVMGPNASDAFPHFGSNFWEDWEREVHLEYFEDGDDLSFASPAGAKIFGGWSRGNPQRSISLFARGRYGANDFPFPFFAERDIDKYEALVLRNSGNDWNISGYRDGFLTGLVSERDLDRQAFQPVEVYFNGEYWGVYNLREKVNEHFLADNHDLDNDEIDLLGFDGFEVIHGDNAHYIDLVDYVNSHGLVTSTEFEYVRDRVDIDNFIDYQLAQIYYDNQDWPGNNIKFWRSHQPGSKWRWVLYDTDFGFGTWNPSNYYNNTLEFATATNGPGWPNPPWSTLFLRKFLNNAEFKNDFATTLCDLLNEPFKFETVQAALNHHQQMIFLAMPNHFSRWGHNNLPNWNQQGDYMENFGLNRPQHIRNHFRNKFGLGQDSQLRVNISPTSAGHVRVHSIVPEDYPWVGQYFANIPLDLRAIAQPGYRFSHWEGVGGNEPDLVVSMLSTIEITAVFEAISPEDGALVINEINYHSPDENDASDWIELHNSTLASINLEGWMVSDDNDDNQFLIEAVTLAPNAYITLTTDSVAFKTIHGEGIRISGDITFNFSNGGEHIRLYNSDHILVDSLTYDDETPWPDDPDGSGPTLELIHPALDNALSSSWAVSDDLGTPGSRNSRYSDPSSLTQEQLPQNFDLGLAYPNPFNASVSLPISLPQGSSVDINIFDIRGRLIRSESIERSAGQQMVYRWDGNDRQGQACSSGMFIIQLTQNSQTQSVKVALLR